MGKVATILKKKGGVGGEGGGYRQWHFQEGGCSNN